MIAIEDTNIIVLRGQGAAQQTYGDRLVPKPHARFARADCRRQVAHHIFEVQAASKQPVLRGSWVLILVDSNGARPGRCKSCQPRRPVRRFITRIERNVQNVKLREAGHLSNNARLGLWRIDWQLIQAEVKRLERQLAELASINGADTSLAHTIADRERNAITWVKSEK